MSDLSLALGLDSLNESHPILQEVASPDEINSLFDTISYSKVRGKSGGEGEGEKGEREREREREREKERERERERELMYPICRVPV